MPDKMLIRNAMIVDGSGREGFRGSVYVVGDRIKAVIPSTARHVDDIDGAEIGTIIDAEGLAVAPGFIDCHSHFDWVLPLDYHQKFLFPLIEQGITTVITGNCGFSPAPVSENSIDLVREFSEILVAKPFPFNWGGMGEFLDHQDSTGGSQMQVGQITSFQASPKLNPAGDGSRIFQRQLECPYLLQAELFETGCGNREICLDPPDYMTLNAFGQ